MEDQVSQNELFDQAQYRAWAELTQAERGAALCSLAAFMLDRHPAWTVEAGAMAWIWGIRAKHETGEWLESPIVWSELSDEAMARRLVELADWHKDDRFRAACMAVADDLARQRRQERDDRER